MKYSELSQKYIEIVDELRGLEAGAEDLDREKDREELNRMSLEHEILTEQTQRLEIIAKVSFGKEPKQIYKDGWDFWFKEDAELRGLCPRCHSPLDARPALSRKDNKTKICSPCGTAEALEELFN